MMPGVPFKSVVRCVFVAAVLLSVPACISAPVQEMSNARQAIAAAEEAGAVDTAPQAIEQARRLLDEAEQSLKIKRYRDARRAAIAAKAEAIKALQTANES